MNAVENAERAADAVTLEQVYEAAQRCPVDGPPNGTRLWIVPLAPPRVSLYASLAARADTQMPRWRQLVFRWEGRDQGWVYEGPRTW